MNSVSVRVPMRADLAGGTLDLWPLYLFHPGARTVNVAVSCFAECEVHRVGGEAIEVHLTDHDYARTYGSLSELLEDPRAALIGKALDHFRISGVRIITRTDAPRGSGLGGSSAMAIALVRALSELDSDPVEADALIELVRDLETRLLGMPAGIQDYYPPVYGGLASIHLLPGRPVRVPIRLPLAELARHFVLHYSDVSHFSGTNNWDIYKRHIDGDSRVRDGLSLIAAAAIAMEKALEAHDLEAAGAALRDEWHARKNLIDGISTPEIDAAIEAALGAGAWGAKVCGAGGGGSLVFLAPADRRAAVVDALRGVPGTTMTALPTPATLEVETEGAHQTILPFTERKLESTAGEPVEQLYVINDRRSAYRPWLLAEAQVTFDAPRAAFRTTLPKTFLAPVDVERGTVDWTAAIETSIDRLGATAEPEAGRGFTVAPAGDALFTAIQEAPDSLRDWLAQREKVTIFHNPRFGLYSEPGESRQSLLERCLEAAESVLDQDKVKLESTLRRLMDQMRERQEKEDFAREDTSPDDPSPEVNIAWGQLIYNITRGRELPREWGSIREGDYMQRIAVLQKVWDRDLSEIREELTAEARALEQVVLVPSPQRIEIRCVLVWVAGSPLRRRRRTLETPI